MSATRWAHAFRRVRMSRFAGPRRPRHRMLRVALGVLGVGLLLGLLFISVFVGIAMLAVGMLWRVWQRRGKPVAHAGGRAFEGSYRVIDKARLPLAR